MSSEALYEQYKDALKRGHVASLRGHVEEALLAYADAARIAPERSTPHSSAGTALLRRKRPADALRHYEVALHIAPLDEAALLGRAQALAALERRGDAADAYDALAEVQATSGRLAEAVDTARRGLELAEGRERRRTLERLIANLRATEPDEPGRTALERALQILHGTAVAPDAGTPAQAGATETHAPTTEAPLTAVPSLPPDRTSARGVAPSAAAVGDGTISPQGEPQSASAEEPAPVAEPPIAVRQPRVLPSGLTTAELAERADAAVDAGEAGPALEALLDVATAYARDGRADAALDACYAALVLDPDNVGLHLALVDLYAERDWSALVGEKLDLLARLVKLDGDEDAMAEVATARAERG